MEVKDIIGAGEVGKEVIRQSGELIKEPLHNVVNPSTETFGNRLSSVFDLVFTPIEMLQIYKNHKVEKFKNKLNTEINGIPKEKRITPPLNLIGPAVEAAKFYIDDDELRDMFAKLIASAMNSDTSTLTHPSFVEIIKQLSPLDAKNISYFKNAPSYSIVDYVVKREAINYTLIKNVSLGLSDCKDIYAISSSLTNLFRLGLLEKDSPVFVKVDKVYMTEEIMAQVEIQMSSTDEQKRDFIHTVSGLIRPTMYGSFFIKACI